MTNGLDAEHNLALRGHDIRHTQEKLAAMGLFSLGPHGARSDDRC